MDESASEVTETVWVPMVDPEIVKQARALQAAGWGFKRIARELGIARNSVRRYLRDGASEEQVRLNARTLDDEQVRHASQLLEGPAQGNGVVVKRLLATEKVHVPLRTLQRALAPFRQAKRAVEVATVRFETPPGEQMQIDFGEKWVRIAASMVRVFFFVAVLGYSRRIFVRASLSQRQDDWREGLVGAFRRFGGVPQRILIDRAGALVIGEDRQSGMVKVHPAFSAFCRDWGVEVSACRPYRARTKGKTESGVGYVKKNAVAGLSFASFAALESHLDQWMVEADERIHGTTHDRPSERFDRAERAALRELPAPGLRVRERLLQRRVANDCFVDVDTVRYSVPWRLVRRTVDVLVVEDEVLIYERGRSLDEEPVARHRRCREPHTLVVEPSHLDGIFRKRDDIKHDEVPSATPLARSLEVYASCIGGDS